MPQLDKVTFLSQFFWLCVFFLGFYIISIKYFLPQMSRILKYRKKRFNQSHQGVNAMQEENNKVRDSTDRLLENGFQNSKEVLKQNLQRTESWLTEYASHTNKTELKDINYNYLHSLGENRLSQNICLQGAFRDFSSTVFVSALISTLQRAASTLQTTRKVSTARTYNKAAKR